MVAQSRLVFDEAIKKAHNHAWEGRWREAAQEYERAAAEFPDSPLAHLNLGMVYLQLGRKANALTHYLQASELTPEDPLPLEKAAGIQEEERSSAPLCSSGRDLGAYAVAQPGALGVAKGDWLSSR
jgi:tetratricopeptide (TPR) repeat protein